MKRIIEHPAHLLRRKALRSDQIRGRTTSPIKSVSPVNIFCGASGSSVSGRNDRYAFGRIARRFQKFQSDGSDMQFVTIADLMGWELRIRPLTVNDLCSGPCRKFDVSAYKISVRMRLDYVLDLLAVRLGFVDVLLNVTLRIDDAASRARSQYSKKRARDNLNKIA